MNQAETGGGRGGDPPRIDLHAHHVSRELIAEAKRAGARYGVRLEQDADGREHVQFVDGPTIRPFFPELCDLEVRLPKLEADRVDLQLISTWTDICGYHLPPAEGARWARLQNDTLAESARARPDQFEAMGTLPLQDVPAALAELDYCTDQLGMRSFEVGTSVDGHDLAEDQFRPFWRRVHELDLLIFLHPPLQPIGLARLGEYFLNNLLGNPMDTTVAAAKLIFSGIMAELPGLKILLAHGGGFLPYQIGRLDRGFARNPRCQVHLDQPPSSFLASFYYDPILFDQQALDYLAARLPCDHLVYGTDYPFEMRDDVVLERIDRIPGLTPEQRAAILGGTAARLLKSPSP